MRVYNQFKGYQFNPSDVLEKRYKKWYDFMEKDKELRYKCMYDYIDDQGSYYVSEERSIDMSKITTSTIAAFAANTGFKYGEEEYQLMQQVEQQILEILASFDTKIEENFNIKEFDINVVLYHGLGNSAGWATTYRGKPAILLGIEKIVELNWTTSNDLENLIYHELLHLIHQKLRKDNDFLELEKGINRFYLEGFATFYESLLSNSKRREDWLNACLQNESRIKRILYQKIIDNDTLFQFFGDWYKVLNIEDTGYFIGYQVIDRLSKKMTLLDIATLNTNTFKQELMTYLNDTTNT